jgi:hypothetical protein
MELYFNESEDRKPTRSAWVFMFVLIALNVGSALWVRFTFDYFHRIERERNPGMNLAMPATAEDEESATELTFNVFTIPFLIQFCSLLTAWFLGVVPWRTEAWGWMCWAVIILSLACWWCGFRLWLRYFLD